MIALEEIAKAIVDLNPEKLNELVDAAIKEGVPAGDIVNNGLIAGMNIIGESFKNGDIFVPEVLVAAMAMHECLEKIRPLLSRGDFKHAGTVIIGTVKGDLHDIGKNLVAMMMEGAGFKVIDLGTDVTPEKFVEAAKEKKPDVVAMSALLTTTMPAMKETIDALKAAGMRESVKVIVGGAPINQDYADQIGADGYSTDASSAVDLLRRMVA